MSIEIRKFRYSTEVKNYFGSGTNYPTFIDKIVLSHIHSEGFPSYSKEFKNEFDVFNFIFGDFEVKFSMLQPDTSDLGYNIAEFLSEDINDCVIVCKLAFPSENIVGFVDITSIWFNETFNQNRYDVKFTCYPPEKEFKDLGAKSPETPAAWFRNINGYLANCHFFTSPPVHLQVDTSNLDWVNRIGFEPTLLTSDLYNNIWGWCISNPYLYEQGQTNDSTVWELFEDLCKFFGLIYKVEYAGEFSGNLWGFKFYIGFRDTAFGTSEISPVYETVEHGYTKDPKYNKYIYFKYGQITRVVGAIENRQFIFNYPEFGYGIVYETGSSYTACGKLVVTAGTTIRDNLIGRTSSEDDYYILQESGEARYFPLRETTEIKASKYFNPTTDEGILYSHWRLGTFGEYIYFNSPYYPFAPMNFSFPMMFQKPLTSVHLNNSDQTVNGKGNWFRTSGLVVGNIYDGIKAIFEHTAQMYQFLLKDVYKKVYKNRISLLSGAYNLFDTTTIRGDEYRLYALTDYDIKERKITGLFEQV